MPKEHKFTILDKNNDKVYKYSVRNKMIYCDECIVNATSCEHVMMAITNKKLKKIIDKKALISETQIKNIYEKNRL